MAGAYQKLQQSRQDLDVLRSKGEALVDDWVSTIAGEQGGRMTSLILPKL